MKITYEANDAPQVLEFVDGVWSGGHEGLGKFLNAPGGVSDFIGKSLYFPTPWHEAKAVADALDGMVDEPKPSYAKGEFKGKRF